jgi:8-oxo-dGTP pyrophosphatase MutT (NUDIX family)
LPYLPLSLYLYGRIEISFHNYSKMPVFNDVINALEEEIRLGLPGWDAQKRMITPDRQKIDLKKIEKNNPRISSVLVWLYPKEDEIFTRLILRTQVGKVHGGQVAFPGGKYEDTDADLWQTALREAFEEIGLPPKEIHKVGELSTVYIPPSNFWVHPFIGYSKSDIVSTIEPAEVQKTIDMNISVLLDAKIKGEKLIIHSNSSQGQKTPFYDIEGYVVWGATAMILSELEELLRKVYGRLK